MQMHDPDYQRKRQAVEKMAERIYTESKGKISTDQALTQAAKIARDTERKKGEK
jgi:hypothetical protein